MNQRELKQSIEGDPNLTDSEKARKLNALCAPYTKMSDEELLQLVRDFTMEYGREPTRKDVLYDRELKKQIGEAGYTLQGFAAANGYLVYGNDGVPDEEYNYKVCVYIAY